MDRSASDESGKLLRCRQPGSRHGGGLRSAYRAGDALFADGEAEIALALAEHPATAFDASDLYGSGSRRAHAASPLGRRLLLVMKRAESLPALRVQWVAAVPALDDVVGVKPDTAAPAVCRAAWGLARPASALQHLSAPGPVLRRQQFAIRDLRRTGSASVKCAERAVR